MTDRRSARRGIMSVTDGKFSDVVREFAGDWIRDGEDRILLSGMIGSRQGAGIAGAAMSRRRRRARARAHASSFRWRRSSSCPVLHHHDEHGTGAGFMRGEDPGIAGLLPTISATRLVL